MRDESSRIGTYLCPICGVRFRRYRCHVRVAEPFCTAQCHGIWLRGSLRRRITDRTSRVAEPSGCVLWMGLRNRQGYGVLQYKLRQKTKTLRAPRCVVMLALGAESYEDVLLLPRWLDVCHMCDNPPCVNPEHLFVAPREMNMHDKVMKGRARRSHLTDDDVRAIRAAYVPGGPTQYDLAAIYGVSQVTIGKIVFRVTWRHVE